MQQTKCNGPKGCSAEVLTESQLQRALGDLQQVFMRGTGNSSRSAARRPMSEPNRTCTEVGETSIYLPAVVKNKIRIDPCNLHLPRADTLAGRLAIEISEALMEVLKWHGVMITPGTLHFKMRSGISHYIPLQGYVRDQSGAPVSMVQCRVNVASDHGSNQRLYTATKVVSLVHRDVHGFFLTIDCAELLNQQLAAIPITIPELVEQLRSPKNEVKLHRFKLSAFALLDECCLQGRDIGRLLEAYLASR